MKCEQVERLFRDVFGVLDRTFAKYPLVIDVAGGMTVETRLEIVIGSWAIRDQIVMEARYGLFTPGGVSGGKVLPWRGVGSSVGLSGEWARQRVKDLLVGLDHYLREYLYVPSTSEIYDEELRRRLSDRLAQSGYAKAARISIARALRYGYLKIAMENVDNIGSILTQSCGTSGVSQCLNCSRPTVPEWSFCSKACRAEYGKITVVCDQCRMSFKRLASEMLASSKTRDGVEGNKSVFCSRGCRNEWMRGRPLKDRCFRTKSRHQYFEGKREARKCDES